MFHCRLLCRLTYALSLNFLAVIHLDGHVTGAVEQVETSFTAVSRKLTHSRENVILGYPTLARELNLVKEIEMLDNLMKHYCTFSGKK